MMKNTELRIGNIVYFDSKMTIGKCVEIATIENTGVRVFNGVVNDKGEKHLTEIIPFDKVEPIKLTRDLIPKLGFSQGTTYPRLIEYYIQPEDIELSFYIWIKDDVFSVELEWDGYGSKIEKQIEYVHELQNLCFALTGVELQLSST